MTETTHVRRSSMRPITQDEVTDYAAKHGMGRIQALDKLKKDRMVEVLLNAQTVDELKPVLMYVIGKLP